MTAKQGSFGFWMKIKVEINNPAHAAIDKKAVEKIAAMVIKDEAKRFAGIGQMEVSVVFAHPAKIRALNKKYRKIDCVTDILSFVGDGLLGNGVWSLGELAICLAQVKKDAKELKAAFKKELAWVVIHGMLHLFGYDHETNRVDARMMQEKEKSYLSKMESL